MFLICLTSCDDAPHMKIAFDGDNAKNLLSLRETFLDARKKNGSLWSMEYFGGWGECGVTDASPDEYDEWYEVGDIEVEEVRTECHVKTVTEHGVRFMFRLKHRDRPITEESALFTWKDIEKVADGHNPFEPLEAS